MLQVFFSPVTSHHVVHEVNTTHAAVVSLHQHRDWNLKKFLQIKL
jgi:hypothetical protein